MPKSQWIKYDYDTSVYGDAMIQNLLEEYLEFKRQEELARDAVNQLEFVNTYQELDNLTKKYENITSESLTKATQQKRKELVNREVEYIKHISQLRNFKDLWEFWQQLGPFQTKEIEGEAVRKAKQLAKQDGEKYARQINKGSVLNLPYIQDEVLNGKRYNKKVDVNYYGNDPVVLEYAQGLNTHKKVKAAITNYNKAT